MLRYIDLMATNHMRSHYAFPESMKRWESSIEKAKDQAAAWSTSEPVSKAPKPPTAGQPGNS